MAVIGKSRSKPSRVVEVKEYWMLRLAVVLVGLEYLIHSYWNSRCLLYVRRNTLRY
jgi:hypothetical protein